jgi:Zn-dependent protease
MTVGASVSDATTTRCEGCGTELSASMLSCPSCHRLVYAALLKDFAASAETASAAGDTPAALTSWRSSLELLPPGSRQRAIVEQKIASLTQQIDTAAASEVPTTGRWKWLATLGPVGLLLWKFKFLLVALLTKGKLLLLGLTKFSTLASMFGMIAVYWAAWGLWFAVGLVVSIYIHEMGHVAALRRYGIAASAPMFIPGFGALVRLKQSPASPREDARIGLAGPVWGLGAAVGASLIGTFGGGAMWLAIAHVGAWLNLFNLTPIWQLDGSRGFASLTRPHRLLATGALIIAWFITRDGIVMLAALVAVWRCFSDTREVPRDWGALATFSFVAVALAVVFALSRTVS